MRMVPASRLVATGLMLISISGCMGWRTTSVAPRQLLATKGVPAVRVTRLDKSKVEIWNPVLQGDSIVGNPTDRAIARLVMPLSQVNTIATRGTSIGRTLLIGLGILGAVGAYGLLQELNQGY